SMAVPTIPAISSRPKIRSIRTFPDPSTPKEVTNWSKT
ncbi:MAG: hypothetical protein ACI9ZX_001438, partial [Algoriphagus sp.]